MNNKMLDLVIKIDGGGTSPMLLAVGLVVLFAVVVALIMKRK